MVGNGDQSANSLSGTLQRHCLLTVKISLPPMRSDFLFRPQLACRLSDGLRRRLTLVSAPAGFGKTTLVSQWCLRNCPHIVWVTLERADNDPARFWAYVFAALQTMLPHLDDSILTLLRSSQPSSVETGLALLINAFTETSEDLVLVLDDYHFIESESIHQALSFLLDHLPLNVHLIISTRTDPPLPLARLRARGQLLEVRASDLALTSEETAIFLNQIMGLHLSSDQMATLNDYTEGWIVALQLVALSLQRCRDPDTLIAAFAGSDRHLMDYFLEEVLNGQPGYVQRFLLHKPGAVPQKLYQFDMCFV